MRNKYKKSFEDGIKTSKLKSKKEAIVVGSIQGIIIGISIFNDFPILVKIVMLISFMLIFGGIASSKKFKNMF